MTRIATISAAAAIAVMSAAAPAMAGGIDHLAPKQGVTSEFSVKKAEQRNAVSCRDMNTSVTAGQPTQDSTQCYVYENSLTGEPLDGGISQYK